MKSYRTLAAVYLAACSMAWAEPAARPERPVLLVPGLWYKYAPLVLKNPVFGPYREWLKGVGYAESDIHVLDYPTAFALPAATRRIADQMQRILRKYPAGTRFDLFGHSLGAFVGLYAVAKMGLLPRIEKFISLAGIPQGWDGLGVCRFGLCGLIHPLLIPMHSNFVTRFYQDYADEIENLDKCSLYSPQDELVRPYDAGRFADGTNVEIADLKHMDQVWSERAFQEMRSHCYPETER